MPTKMMPSSRKPPLARSPIRLRPRHVLQSCANTIQTTPPPAAGSLTKRKLSISVCGMEELDLRPEYRTISCELKALARMVNQEFGSSEMAGAGLGNISTANWSALFERGRFYEEYSARRNERLKRKKGETGEDKKPVYDLGVRVECAKRRETKRYESLRKAVSSTPLTERREGSTSRYSLRSATSKENKKPPVDMNIEKSAGIGTKRTRVRRTRKI